jgi:hypothetical protein
MVRDFQPPKSFSSSVDVPACRCHGAHGMPQVVEAEIDQLRLSHRLEPSGIAGAPAYGLAPVGEAESILLNLARVTCSVKGRLKRALDSLSNFISHVSRHVNRACIDENASRTAKECAVR